MFCTNMLGKFQNQWFKYGSYTLQIVALCNDAVTLFSQQTIKSHLEKQRSTEHYFDIIELGFEIL